MKVRLQIMFTPVGHCRLLGFVLIMERKIFSISPLNMVLAMDFHRCPLLC